MSDIDRSCPDCGSDDRQLHADHNAWECDNCGTVYQEILQTDADGNATERLATSVLEHSDSK